MNLPTTLSYPKAFQFTKLSITIFKGAVHRRGPREAPSGNPMCMSPCGICRVEALRPSWVGGPFTAASGTGG